MNPVDKLAEDIRRIDGDHKLGAGELAEELVKLGWVRPAPVLDSKMLQSGLLVEVLRHGTWTPGRVSQIGPGGLIDVDTERGPWSGYATKNGLIRLPVPTEK